MDDLYPLNHRKRKADNDDSNVPPSVPVVPQDPLLSEAASSSSASTPGPSSAPRQTWLTGASGADSPLWTSSRTTTPKRPRLEIEVPSRLPGRKSSRRSPTKHTPTKSPSVRQPSDIEDIGIVPSTEPGPSRGSLLHRGKDVDRASALSLSFDPYPIPAPPLVPLINRQTLKELDLDAILRNPQLRHDLLFDPGLQFRPTSSRRKRDLSEKYWAAVIREIETGCTCVSFDSQGTPHQPVLCICSYAKPSSSTPTLHQVQSNLYTSRMPSRIPSLLTEFLEVLLIVIQPLCTISGTYVTPGSFKSQMQEHSVQATYIRSLFDPVLIEQELRRGIFDPSGLFRTIGATLKGHCAPMRDQSVETMVRAAESCGSKPDSSPSRDAINAIRMCMEILELMKLDIANHQLQTLRPFLIRTSGQFELRTLKARYGAETPLSATREWIEAAHDTMLRTQPISHPHLSTSPVPYSTLSVNQQLYISIVRGLVDLVFNPPLTTSSPMFSSSNSPPSSPAVPSVSTPLPLFPETLYLDMNRMLLLSSDATDATALYMLLLLYRQLAFSENSNSRRTEPMKKVTEADMLKMKNEIRDIAGSFRLGCCFSRDDRRSGNKDAERWKVVKEDLVLQIARRAREFRGASAVTTSHTPSSTAAVSSSSSPASSLSSSSTSTSTTTSQSHSLAMPSSPSPSSPIGDADHPNPQTLGLGRKWVDSHMQPESALSAMLHNRLRDVVFNAVLISTYPGRDLTNGCRPLAPLNLAALLSPNRGNVAANAGGDVAGTTSGMEPLSDEIRTLVDKISLLALIHLNAYLPLYEKEGLIPSSC